MKTIPNLLLQKRLMLRLGAIITSGFTVLCSPLTVLGLEVSGSAVTSQKTPTLSYSSPVLIAQNNPNRRIIRTKLLDGDRFNYLGEIGDLRSSQGQTDVHIGEDGNPLLVGATVNEPNDYFIVQEEFEEQSIGFVIRRSDLYLQGYIRNYDPTNGTGRYYYFNDANITSLEFQDPSIQSNNEMLNVGSNYNSLLRGNFDAANFNLNDLRQSFRNLVRNDPNSNASSINIALVRFAVVISEAMRFRPVAELVGDLFNQEQNNPINDPSLNAGRIDFPVIHSDYLSTWSNRSRDALNARNQEQLNRISLILGLGLFIKR